MPLPDTMFCAQQIRIPPELPDILKQFTKAAIRTQPNDVLQWSAGYFSALSRGDPLPVKDRIEMPVATQKTDTGLTQGLLKVLHKQCSHKQYVELAHLEQKWKNLCLPVENFRTLLQLDPCENKIEWIKFLALGCSMLGGVTDIVNLAYVEVRLLGIKTQATLQFPRGRRRSGDVEGKDEYLPTDYCLFTFHRGFPSLNTSMKHLCEILTTDPEGGPARIPFETFSYVYRYLSKMDSDVPEGDTESYLATLKDTVDSRKNGMIGLSDFFILTRKV